MLSSYKKGVMQRNFINISFLHYQFLESKKPEPSAFLPAVHPGLQVHPLGQVTEKLHSLSTAEGITPT